MPELDTLLDQIEQYFKPKPLLIIPQEKGTLLKTAAAVGVTVLIYLAGFLLGNAPSTPSPSFDERTVINLLPDTYDQIERDSPKSIYGEFLVATCGTTLSTAAVAEKRLHEIQPEIFELWNQAGVTTDLLGRTWYAATNDWEQSAFVDFIPPNPTTISFCKLAKRLREVADSLELLTNPEIRQRLPEPIAVRLSLMLDLPPCRAAIKSCGQVVFE